MSESENLFGEEHIRRYRETGGAVGHVWREGSKVLVLTTTGRRSGRPRDNALIYENDGDRYVVVASRGGSPQHPAWYLNLVANPDVEVQVQDDVFKARAHTATGEERTRLWKLAARQWPAYDTYQERTDREIPVVVLERA
ncbi:MAG: nitroreductase family deazaflavin-dependent oxidoreductase [Candidatus Dormibacteraeota bacterium]|nr:nitroreductase family deazaflavin-dependent oxidoreductase [Candidatus Dormibacteraeota bacterium]